MAGESNSLDLTQMVEAQKNKATTSNDGNGQLNAALCETEVLDFTSGDVTLTDLQYRRNFTFRTDNLTVARTLTVLAIARVVNIDNTNGTAVLTVALAGSTIEVAAGLSTWISTDGVAGNLRDLRNGPHEDFIFFPVEGHINPTAAGGAAALATVATAADQPDVTSLDFNQTTAEHAQLRHVFDKAALLGNVSFQGLWSHAAASTFGLALNFKGVSVSNDDLLAQNFGTARKIVDVGGTTNDHYLTERTGFVKVATPADNDLAVFDIFRDPVDGGDNLDVDARLQGVLMHFWRNQPLDPHWASVELLAGFDGENTATDQDDESDNAFTATYVANAQVDTAQSKFSRASLRVDGTGDLVTYPDDTAWAFGSGNFTIEGWYRWNTDPAGFQHLIGQWDSGGDQRSFALFRDQPGGQLELWLSTVGTDGIEKVTATWDPVLDTWYHMAADWDGTTYRIYVDGVPLAEATGSETLHNSTAALSVGASIGAVNPFDGWADDPRITSVARYAGAFERPSAPFPRA